MVWIDYAIIGIVGFSALISLVRGFVKEAMSLVTWFVAFFIASHFYPDLAAYFTSFSDALVRNGLAIAALFRGNPDPGQRGELRGGSAGGQDGALRYRSGAWGLLRRNSRGTDRQCPAFFMDTFTSLSQSDWWAASKLVPEFKPVIQWFFGFMLNSSSFLKQV